ncbi:MAG TPA: hypothetical protein VGM64_02500 [Lacunisphaera sp.]|jgi:hypothetical protein
MIKRGLNERKTGLAQRNAPSFPRQPCNAYHIVAAKAENMHSDLTVEDAEHTERRIFEATIGSIDGHGGRFRSKFITLISVYSGSSVVLSSELFDTLTITEKSVMNGGKMNFDFRSVLMYFPFNHHSDP